MEWISDIDYDRGTFKKNIVRGNSIFEVLCRIPLGGFGIEKREEVNIMLENINLIEKDGEWLANSREVASNFNKNHKEVLRIINDKINHSAILRSDKYFIENRYKAGTGKEYKEYLMTRDGFSFLVMGFTGRKADEWKIKYIEAFNSMEKQIQNQYKLPQNPMDVLKLMFKVSEEHEDKLNKLEIDYNKLGRDVKTLGENAYLSPGEYNAVSNMISDRIRVIKSNHCLINANKNQNTELFRAINRDIKEITGIYTRSQLRKKDLDKVIELVRNWEPSKALLMKIDQLQLNLD